MAVDRANKTARMLWALNQHQEKFDSKKCRSPITKVMYRVHDSLGSSTTRSTRQGAESRMNASSYSLRRTMNPGKDQDRTDATGKPNHLYVPLSTQLRTSPVDELSGRLNATSNGRSQCEADYEIVLVHVSATNLLISQRNLRASPYKRCPTVSYPLFSLMVSS